MQNRRTIETQASQKQKELAKQDVIPGALAEDEKKRAALWAAGEIRDGMLLGLGTGSTVRYLVEQVGWLVSQGMRLRAVATSKKTEELARSFGIPLLEISELCSSIPGETGASFSDRQFAPSSAPPMARSSAPPVVRSSVQPMVRSSVPPMEQPIDLAIDGVDALDPLFYAVKGGGGALFREKVVAGCAKRVIWILDESKRADHLSRAPLPVEVVPFGWQRTKQAVESLGFTAVLRLRGPWDLPLEGAETDGPYQTDNGNYILDLKGNPAMNYKELAEQLKSLTGVVETGFFANFCDRAVVGTKEGVEVLINR